MKTPQQRTRLASPWRLLAIRAGGATYYTLTDHQNTVHGFVDATGVIVARYVYDAWGNVLSEAVTASALVGNRYRFQGREYSAVTGLYNFRARWYDPATGRWISKDPIGINGGLNMYVFCGNDPVNFIDPFGLLPKALKDALKGWRDSNSVDNAPPNESTAGGDSIYPPGRPR